MLFKMAALFVIAATTHVETTGATMQWVYESGANKGYVCAVMEKDGTKFDVYVPAATANTRPITTTALTPVPWQQQFSTQAAAETAIKEFCK